MGLDSEARASLVFLILYTIPFTCLLFGYVTGRLRLRSSYTVIFFHVTIRLASQAIGLAFGIVGSNTSLIEAYFILGAEGYFTLVVCSYHFLIEWQNHNTASHHSWLKPGYPPGTSLFQRFISSFIIIGPRRQPMSVIHNLLICANAILIVGGSMLAGGHESVQEFRGNLKNDEAMRTAGQSVFLAVNIFLLYCVVDSISQSRLENPDQATHPTLLLLLAACPLLFVRGLYGVMSAVLPMFNYFNWKNYGPRGLVDSFVISEYTMATTMEWTTCMLLMLTYLTSRNDPKKGDWEMCEGKKGRSGDNGSVDV